MVNPRKIVFYALYLAVALVLSYLESILPFSLGIPGAKIGLPNIVTVLLLYSYGAYPAACISILRIFLSAVMFGNFFSMAYSMGGFVLSFAAMVLTKRSGLFGIIGISCVGGISHNIGQLLVAAFITNRYVFSYLPVLMLAGVISGLVIGKVSSFVIKRLDQFLPH